MIKRLLLLLFFLIPLISCGSDHSAEISTNVSLGEGTGRIYVAAQTVPEAGAQGSYAEGELLVKFRKGVLMTTAHKTHQALGARVKRTFSLVPGLQNITIPQGLSVRDAVKQYMNNPDVEYAEPNYRRYKTATLPNDPLFSQHQWPLRNTGQSFGTPGADIKATEGWDITTGGSDVIIAVLDTGVDLSHPDLAANLMTGFNFVNDTPPSDDDGHGTHVSGIIGAPGNNGTGISGVMWSTKLMPLKFIGLYPDGYYGTIADEAEAIGYAVSYGAKVINASFSGGSFSNVEYDALSSANAAGVLVMAAAGNSGKNNDASPEYPASYNLPNIIAVAATDDNDSLANFSDYGPKSVHVAAPGDAVFSTVPGSYGLSSGTSQAAPHVAGLAGLLYSYYPHFTATQVRGTILRYVDLLPSLSGKIITGGRINAAKALSSLLPPANLSAGVSSSAQVTLTWTDNATGEDGYKIERKGGSGAFNQIADVGPNTTSYTDSGLADSLNYTYRVRAYNTIPADSLYSNEASATTLAPLSAPANLTAAALSTSQVRISWIDTSLSEDGFRIERKVPFGGFIQIAQIGSNQQEFIDSGLSPSTEYTYRVRAFSTTGGNSAYSNEASATTSADSSSGGGGGGGGGCSVSAQRGATTALADLFVILMPFIILLIMKKRGGLR